MFEDAMDIPSKNGILTISREDGRMRKINIETSDGQMLFIPY